MIKECEYWDDKDSENGRDKHMQTLLRFNKTDKKTRKANIDLQIRYNYFTPSIYCYCPY